MESDERLTSDDYRGLSGLLAKQLVKLLDTAKQRGLALPLQVRVTDADDLILEVEYTQDGGWTIAKENTLDPIKSDDEAKERQRWLNLVDIGEFRSHIRECVKSAHEHEKIKNQWSDDEAEDELKRQTDAAIEEADILLYRATANFYSGQVELKSSHQDNVAAIRNMRGLAERLHRLTPKDVGNAVRALRHHPDVEQMMDLNGKDVVIERQLSVLQPLVAQHCALNKGIKGNLSSFKCFDMLLTRVNIWKRKAHPEKITEAWATMLSAKEKAPLPWTVLAKTINSGRWAHMLMRQRNAPKPTPITAAALKRSWSLKGKTTKDAFDRIIRHHKESERKSEEKARPKIAIPPR